MKGVSILLLSNAVIQRIDFLLNKHQMTLWDLYKKSGVPKSTICNLMNSPNALPKLITLQHICEAFGITIREFFDDSLFDDTEQE